MLVTPTITATSRLYFNWKTVRIKNVRIPIIRESIDLPMINPVNIWKLSLAFSITFSAFSGLSKAYISLVAAAAIRRLSHTIYIEIATARRIFITNCTIEYDVLKILGSDTFRISPILDRIAGRFSFAVSMIFEKSISGNCSSRALRLFMIEPYTDFDFPISSLILSAISGTSLIIASTISPRNTI